MTRNLHTARACLAGAALAFTSGIYAVLHNPPWLGVFGFYGSAFLLWLARCHYRDHHQQLLRHERARRAAIVDDLILGQVLPTCCSFWQHSDGLIHGPNCTRPPDAGAEQGDACCERWWTSLGADHDTTCEKTPRSRAA